MDGLLYRRCGKYSIIISFIKIKKVTCTWTCLVLFVKTLYTMAHKIITEISKDNFIQTNENLKKDQKELRAYMRSWIYVPKTMNIICKFCMDVYQYWVSFSKSSKRRFTISGINSKSFGPSHQIYFSPIELVLDFVDDKITWFCVILGIEFFY